VGAWCFLRIMTKAVEAQPAVAVHCAFDDMVPIADLKPNPRNPNKHPEKQIALLAKIIQTQGWRAPITVSNRSGLIVRGHGRLEAAKLAGLTECPVDRQDYESEAAEHSDMLADNQLAELAETDFASLADLLLELDTANASLDLTGFDQSEIESIMTWTPGGAQPPNVDEHYQGLPAMYQPDVTPYKTLIVHFLTEEDYAAFGKLIDRALTPDTKYLWIPKTDFDQYNRGKAFVSE
jgi:hypothetical protein